MPDASKLAGYGALAWVPAQADYVFTAPTLAAGLASIHELEAGGDMLKPHVAEMMEEHLKKALSFNPLSAFDLTNLGVDVNAGIAVFSTGVSASVVFHLSDSKKMLDHVNSVLGAAGVMTIEVDGVKIASIVGGENPLALSWAIDNGWMWIHFGITAEKEAPGAWFHDSHSANGAFAGGADFQWALASTHTKVGSGETPLLGFANPARIVAAALPMVGPLDAMATCHTSLIAKTSRSALSITNSATDVGGVLAVDIGDAASIAGLHLPVSDGWAAASKDAPLSFAWNLDAAGISKLFESCSSEHHVEFPARGIRGFINSIDLDGPSGSGVVWLDLTNRKFIDSQLDQIPGRSMMESKKKFGNVEGRSSNVPMIGAFDYFIDDTRFAVSMGDGLLTRAIGAGGVADPASSPLGELSLKPNGFSRAFWNNIAGRMMGDAEKGKSAVDALLHWQQLQLRLAAEGSTLVLTADGTRAPTAATVAAPAAAK